MYILSIYYMKEKIDDEGRHRPSPRSSPALMWERTPNSEQVRTVTHEAKAEL